MVVTSHGVGFYCDRSQFSAGQNAILDTGSVKIINFCLALPMGWQRHVCPD